MDFNELLQFLKRLTKNNNKEWFDANKKQYDTLRKDWIVFTETCIKTIGAIDDRILTLEPKQCIFRINRDVRFSKDKSPYKTNFGMSLNPGGKKAEFCGYYLHIEPGNCFVAGGAYMPSPQNLAAIRQEIDYQWEGFEKIILTKTFKSRFGSITGDKLVRPPKGYEAENPAIEYLKMKGFIAQRKLEDTDLSDKKLMTTLLKDIEIMKPFVDFIGEAIH